MRLPAGVVLVVAAGIFAAACGGGRQRPAEGPTPATAEETLNELFNLTGLYQRLGRVAAGPPIPFVGQVAFLAGRGDSTIALLGVSLDNRALAFQRSGRDFVARYRVEMSFQRPGVLPVRFSREETVSVATFQETQRVDETVVFQQGFLLAPGDYTLAVVVRDPESGAFSRGERSVSVPALGPGSTTAPILVYQADGRADLWAEPRVVLNPRGTVAHGDDSLAVYFESYGPTLARAVPVEVTDETGRAVLRDSLRFTGGRAVEWRMLHLAAETPSLGRLTVSSGTGESVKRTDALVSFSRAWVLTNYDNLLSLLRYFGRDEQLDALRKATPENRAALWRDFWEASDPNPETPENEALDLYFTRVAIANVRFRDEGGASGGWRTERGEVFITVGEPDQMYESPPGSDPRYVQWVYSEYRAVLTFSGAMGFSRLRLTPASRAEFARLRALVRQRSSR